ncbi:hypothetical protein BBJ28_00011110, partial [Nothophytophthora sp. Chile5]
DMAKKKSKKSKKTAAGGAAEGTTTTASQSADGEKKEQPWTRVLDAANAVSDVMVDFQAFQTFTRHSANAAIRSAPARSLSAATRDHVVALFEANMKALYQESDWGYDAAAKRVELFEDEARYLLAFDKDGDAASPPIGFAHFRFVEDDGVPVLYLYEVQLASTAQRRGLGKFLMQLLQLVARRHGMELMVLTVFKSNSGAMRFYRDRLGFAVDETSPSACGDDSQSYEILSKGVASS